MIRGGFLSADERQALTELVQEGLVENRVGRRAHAVVLLDRGWSSERIADLLLVDDDAVHKWYRAYERSGFAGLKELWLP